MIERETAEKVVCNDEVHEQDSLDIDYPACDLPSSLCQDHNDSIVVEGMQEMDENTVETMEVVKRGKENVNEEEYDEKKELEEIAKKRKMSKGRSNNIKRIRLEYLRKKKRSLQVHGAFSIVYKIL